MSKPLHQIIINPILTEKSVQNQKIRRYTRQDAKSVIGGTPSNSAIGALTDQSVRKYTFRVALDANKTEIAQAFEAIFTKEKVKVAKVHTVHMRGKERRQLGRRTRSATRMGKSPDWKKAIITLTPDSPGIPMLEGV